MNIDADDFLRRVLRDLFDVHAARRRGDEGEAPGIAIQHQAQVNLARDLRAHLHIHLMHRQSRRAGLMRDQRGAEHRLWRPREPPRRSLATLTPPALPRPPACTWAFTTHNEPPRAWAAATAASGESATWPLGRGWRTGQISAFD